MRKPFLQFQVVFFLFIILIFCCQLHDGVNGSPAPFLHSLPRILPQTVIQYLKPLDSIFLFALAIRKLRAKPGAPTAVKTLFLLNLVFPP